MFSSWMHAGVLRTREKRTRPRLNGGTEKDLTAIERAEMKLITSGRKERLGMGVCVCVWGGGGGGLFFPSPFLSRFVFLSPSFLVSPLRPSLKWRANTAENEPSVGVHQYLDTRTAKTMNQLSYQIGLLFDDQMFHRLTTYKQGLPSPF